MTHTEALSAHAPDADRPTHRQQRAWTDADLAQVLALYQQGRTFREIGAAIGRSRNAIAGFFHRRAHGIGVAVERAPKQQPKQQPKRVRNPTPCPKRSAATKRGMKHAHFAENRRPRVRFTADVVPLLARPEPWHPVRDPKPAWLAR